MELCFEGSKINIQETMRAIKKKKKTCVKSYSHIYFLKILNYEGVVSSLCAKILLKDDGRVKTDRSWNKDE